MVPITDDEALVTFVWRAVGPTTGVLILGGWHGYHSNGNQLSRLANTDVWYRTYRMSSTTNATYHFLPNDRFDDTTWWQRLAAAQPDRLNSRQLIVPKDEADPNDREIVLSVLSLPQAPDIGWLTEPGTPDAQFRRLLVGDRDVDVWSSEHPRRLLVLFDGPFFQQVLRVDRMLPPMVVAFVGHAPAERHEELHGSPSFGTFIARELVPALRAAYDVSPRPEHTIIAGSSHGGLAAGLIALEHPDVFGSVLAMSGQFEWLTDSDWRARSEGRRLRWFLTVGSRETWLGPPGGPNRVVANRNLRAVLEATGHEVDYQELDTGHDYLSWRQALATGLAGL